MIWSWEVRLNAQFRPIRQLIVMGVAHAHLNPQIWSHWRSLCPRTSTRAKLKYCSRKFITDNIDQQLANLSLGVNWLKMLEFIILTTTLRKLIMKNLSVRKCNGMHWAKGSGKGSMSKLSTIMFHKGLVNWNLNYCKRKKKRSNRSVGLKLLALKRAHSSVVGP